MVLRSKQTKQIPSFTKNEMLVRCGLMVALALVLSIVENLFPLPAPVPGIKLGIANIVVVLTAYWLGIFPAGIVFLTRVFLAAILTGQLMTLPFSLAGGGLAFLVIVLFVSFGSSDTLRLCSMCAAVMHNIDQVVVAIALTATAAIAWYAPILIFVGLITGFITGSIAQALLSYIPSASCSKLSKIKASHD